MFRAMWHAPMLRWSYPSAMADLNPLSGRCVIDRPPPVGGA
jgi:hypothetical protein